MQELLNTFDWKGARKGKKGGKRKTEKKKNILEVIDNGEEQYRNEIA